MEDRRRDPRRAERNGVRRDHRRAARRRVERLHAPGLGLPPRHLLAVALELVEVRAAPRRVIDQVGAVRPVDHVLDEAAVRDGGVQRRRIPHVLDRVVLQDAVVADQIGVMIVVRVALEHVIDRRAAHEAEAVLEQVHQPALLVELGVDRAAVVQDAEHRASGRLAADEHRQPAAGVEEVDQTLIVDRIAAPRGRGRGGDADRGGGRCGLEHHRRGGTARLGRRLRCELTPGGERQRGERTARVHRWTSAGRPQQARCRQRAADPAARRVVSCRLMPAAAGSRWRRRCVPPASCRA